jgi:ATP-dependent DNA helicase RecQ
LYSGRDVQINKYLITRGNEDAAANPELQAHNLELLKFMTFYATGNDCLRHRLLAYFGESAPLNCGHCSNCLTEFEESDVSLEGQKIISCVYRLKQRGRSFGKTMIIDILRGSKNEKILRLDLHTLSTWGLMADTSARRIRVILDFLIDEGCLALEDGEYPVVTLANAEGVLKGQRLLLMKLTREKKKSEPRELNAGPPDTAAARSCKPGEKPMSVSDFDPILFEKLKALRKELATKEAVPAYIVFSDSSLRDMCRKKPVSLLQFSGVNGVGEVKLEKYGELFTGLIRNYTAGDFE